MKKVKQVLAILLILILIGLYVSTLVFAIIGSERAMVWLKISIYATIVLPVLLWAYGFIYKMIKDDNEKYLEEIPDSRKGNYWRDAVRIITKEVYDKILSLSNINYHIDNVETEFTTTITEGKTKKTYST